MQFNPSDLGVKTSAKLKPTQMLTRRSRRKWTPNLGLCLCTIINTAGALKRGVQLLQGPAREALPCLADADGLGNEEREKFVKCFAESHAVGSDNPRDPEPRGHKKEPKTATITFKSAIFRRFSPPRQLDSQKCR